MPPGESKTWTVGAYAGPKNYHRLNGMKNGLDTIMDMNRFFFWRPAWMGFLSRVLLDGMVWISSLFPASTGWGMGIICLTLLVKLLFWPLSHKSTVSMRRMQALQPQLKEMREKYKDDPTKLYRKQQELFKEHKVSQFGGCLPMLFQIPVFFALFNTFRNAVELRHAGFLWAVDLSMPDTLAFSPSFLPIRPLALLMGAAMFWQQKITPSADPQQAKMMNMMTIFFMVLFYGMPSALTLYMTVNYILESSRPSSHANWRRESSQPDRPAFSARKRLPNMDNSTIRDQAINILTELLQRLDITAQIQPSEDDDCKIDIKSDEGGRLIGRKGQYLESLELVMNRILRRQFADEPATPWIILDVDGYCVPKPSADNGEGRRRRRGFDTERFETMALDAAKEVKRWGSPRTRIPAWRTPHHSSHPARRPGSRNNQRTRSRRQRLQTNHHPQKTILTPARKPKIEATPPSRPD